MMKGRILAGIGLALVGLFFLLFGSLSQGFYHKKKEKAQEVQVSLKEWAIEPKEIAVAGGKVNFVVRNQGSFPHALRVEGKGLDKRSGTISPGKSATLEVSLNTEGEYAIFCPVTGHKEQGMVGKLRVALQQEKGQPGAASPPYRY